MKKVKLARKETITIRPTREYAGIAKKMNDLARRDKRSLNNYILILFEKHAAENGL